MKKGMRKIKNLWDVLVKYHVRTVIVIAVVVNLLVVLLSYLPGYDGELPVWVTQLPLVNATLNSFTFVFLLLALIAILRKNITLHQRFIYAAFTSTALFLVSYVTYHMLAPSTSFGETGLIASIYYFILITHIVLAAIIVPLALMSFFTGYKDMRSTHRKWVRWTMPLWLYVSATGVIVYIMIAPYY